MTKPTAMRMKIHEATYAPEYVQAYSADEMDAYIATLKAALAEMTEILVLFCEEYPAFDQNSKRVLDQRKTKISHARALLEE